MRKLNLTAAPLALVACSQEAAIEEAAAEEETTATEAPLQAATIA